ncbi:alpha/beta hydrolase [Cytophagaceae bacterium YF14B1]|uniref:Alpha/beta hydrolase n=1 Tax=Xanthocytophaga flava TaxID=3048013 RepID=A0AAE3QVG2_9BACT|nr:alpha/beta hydrolase [Xanthocytophaga flavus]MDJ1483534.1 alpha/beta hydrolase [Xanthocytophaga flavus]
MQLKHFISLSFLCIVTTTLFAQTPATTVSATVPEPILLWPEGAPGALGDTDEDKPAIYPFPAPKETATGAAVLICPGGGYINRAMEHEGYDLARWFNQMGITAFVLRYRVNNAEHKKYGYPHAFHDATRAMRTIRSRAKEWSIDPDKIGLMGFSAGGHLASMLGTHFDNGNSKAKNVLDKTSSRPSFLMLIYPVISFTTPYTHRGSRDMQIGPDLDSTLAEYMSTENHVTSFTPPTFLMYTDDDPVLADNAVLFYMGLRKAKVPAELHIYEKGGHGYGMANGVGKAPNNPILATWTDRLKDWLKNRGIVKK